jgi:hypothetical protein
MSVSNPESYAGRSLIFYTTQRRAPPLRRGVTAGLSSTVEGSQAGNSPALIPSTNAAKDEVEKTSAGPSGSFESRTGTLLGKLDATSTQLPPS